MFAPHAQEGVTALHLACKEGHFEVVHHLIKAQALLNIVDEVCIVAMYSSKFIYIKYTVFNVHSEACLCFVLCPVVFENKNPMSSCVPLRFVFALCWRH